MILKLNLQKSSSYNKKARVPNYKSLSYNRKARVPTYKSLSYNRKTRVDVVVFPHIKYHVRGLDDTDPEAQREGVILPSVDHFRIYYL